MNTARLTHSLCQISLLSLSLLPTAVLLNVVQAVPAQAQSQGGLDAYRLGPGDSIRIDVFNVPEYSGNFPILVDGTVNLPVVGTIPMNGLTLPQASDILSRQYSRFVRRPIVTVGLLTPRPIRVAIAGEVAKAGSYSIPLTNGFPTLSQVVQLAGGASQTSDLRNVKVQRRGRIATINLLNVLQRADVSQDISLRDGDTIYIPTATNVNATDIARTVGSNIGSQDASIKIALVGEVSKPGTYSMKGESSGTRISLPTLTEAIRFAGGATASADIGNIRIKRTTKTGGFQIIAANLIRLLDNGELSQDLVLQDGDTIYLPTDSVINSATSRRLITSSFGPQVANPIKVAIVGEVNRPGTYNIQGVVNNAGSGVTNNSNVSPPTVTQAIQFAGGIKPTANIREVILQRYSRNGRGQSVKVNLWNLLTKGDISQDLLLQEGDRIFISRATEINPSEVDTLANAPFAPTTIKVGVVGEAVSRGRLDLPANTTLNQALLAAGGFDPVRANKSSVDLIRLNPNGTVTKRTIGVDFAQNINEENNPTLRNNDVIVVGRSGLTRVGDGLGSVLNPLSPLLTILNLFRR